MEKGSSQVIKILKNAKFSQPFFLLINIMEAHSPYLRNDLNCKLHNEAITKWLINNGTDDPVVEELRKSYPKHAAYAVKRAVEIIMALKPYLDDSLVIITSDHGELLGDGGLGHGYFLRDGLLRVPLWVKWPSWVKPPRQVGPFVSLTQIPSIIRAIINNEEPKIGTNIAIAESFGIAPYHTIDTTRLNYEKALKLLTHRVRIYTKHGTATYNTDLDQLEEVNGDENELRKITKDAINALQYLLPSA
jgi:arylsulfatase A-like enzyme